MERQLSQSNWRTVAQKRERDSIELICKNRMLRIEKAKGKVYEEDWVYQKFCVSSFSVKCNQ